jgi:hypothetical protein
MYRIFKSLFKKNTIMKKLSIEFALIALKIDIRSNSLLS